MDGITTKLQRVIRNGYSNETQPYVPPANSSERISLEFGQGIIERWVARIGTFTAVARNRKTAIRRVERLVRYHENAEARRA